MSGYQQLKVDVLNRCTASRVRNNRNHVKIKLDYLYPVHIPTLSVELRMVIGKSSGPFKRSACAQHCIGVNVK